MSDGTRLYNIRRTLVAMLVERGYLVTQQQKDETLADFNRKWKDEPTREKLRMHLRKKDDPTDQIFVFFPDEPKVGVKPIKAYCEKMREGSVQRAIIVVQQGITAFAKQALNEMHPLFKLEQFSETELLVNITQHQLLPKHVKLLQKEKTALLQKYKVKESQLPRIQVTDPVARFYGLERGEVVKIIRPSETAGRYVTYRLVV